ncbi:hypothetical protein GPECTOR_59g635 [Gonium pectorale]|uniref:N-acetyltransferase domain-containing protein n=1 Tax=Gonium pectorale TaxID=33097 RepID=A0A150G5A4_GONPE|nr:hypothetical protein GPECTOR_59g635 [Gonium pectorale]|eukprot:KXZ45027.1 hypothetical protein GPECTOR_59g635 [Gonium pectorale]
MEKQCQSLRMTGADKAAHLRAAECFGRALVDDPTLNWLTDGKRPQVVVRFFTRVAHMSLRAIKDHRDCWQLLPVVAAATDSNGAEATAAVAPAVVCIGCEYPRHHPSDLRLLFNGLIPMLAAVPSLRSLRFISETMDIMDLEKEAFHKAHGPFLYIACYGTEPGLQGRGLGSQLLQAVIADAEERGIPLYLEANSPGSRRFYERHGFEMLREIRAKPQAPPLFVMARLPSSRNQPRQQDAHAAVMGQQAGKAATVGAGAAARRARNVSALGSASSLQCSA